MRYLWCILAAMLLLTVPAHASPEETVMDEAQRQIDKIDSTQWDSFINELADEYGESGVVKPFKETVGEILANNGRGVESVFDILTACFMKNIPSAVALLIKVLVLGILCGIIERLQGTVSSGSVVSVARFVVFALAGIILFEIFKTSVTDAVTAIDRMLRFMEIILPILVLLLTSMGAAASAGIIQPVSAVLFGIIGTVIKGAVVPITLSGAAVSLVDKLSPNIKLDKLSSLLKNAAQWILGGVFTVFTATVAIKGLSASSYDGIFLRTAKFAVSGMVPVIGGMLGESADLIIGCGGLVKNTVGTAGLAVIAWTVAAPCIRLLVVVLAMRGCAALLQPAASGGIPDIISEAAGSVMLLFVSVAVCGLMVFLTVALTVAMGSGVA